MKQNLLISIPLMFLAMWLWGCEHDTTNGPIEGGDDVVVTDKTCLGCHSSETELKAALGDKATLKFSTHLKDDG